MYWFAPDAGASGPTPPLRREAQRRILTDPALAVAPLGQLRFKPDVWRAI